MWRCLFLLMGLAHSMLERINGTAAIQMFLHIGQSIHHYISPKKAQPKQRIQLICESRWRAEAQFNGNGSSYFISVFILLYIFLYLMYVCQLLEMATISCSI